MAIACRWTMLLALLALCAGCRGAHPAIATERLAPRIVNDDRLLRRLERNAAPLCESGAARTPAELAAQLEVDSPPPTLDLPRSTGRPLPLPALYEQCGAGVLLITRMYKCEKCPNWHHSGEGSGFVLTADGVCVCCRHSFEKEARGFMVAATWDGAVFPITQIVASSRADDIAVFRVDTFGKPLTPIPLADPGPAGSPVCVIAHPRHHHYLLTTGVIARHAEKGGGIRGNLRDGRREFTPVLNITADFGVGSSGAPVLNPAGAAVGMVVSTITVYAAHDDEQEPQMALKNCTPATQIRRLLEAD
jgi:hypothetical protein